jgi:hypothetical protein
MMSRHDAIRQEKKQFRLVPAPRRRDQRQPPRREKLGFPGTVAVDDKGEVSRIR